MKSPYIFLDCVLGFAFATPTDSHAQEFTNHTYQLIAAPLTWQQAKEDAERRGGHLATITSQAELDHILSLGLPFHSNDAYWLGATDEGHEGTWVWVTGEAWDFSRWSSGEPNN